MKMNKLAVATFATIASFSFPLSALALDARDFANKLSSTLAVSAGYEIKFENATANGDTITLSDWSIPALKENKATKFLSTPIVFLGVKETENGGYSAKNAIFEDIDYTDDEINVKINNISISDISIPANAEEDILASMALYKSFNTGEISVSNNGDKVFNIDSMIATNETNEDKSIFSGIFKVNGIFGDLSKIEEEDARVGLAAVGLNAIEGDISGNATWELADGRLRMDEFAFDFKNIGRLNMVMDFSGYTLEVIESITKINKELAMMDLDSAEYEAKSMEMMMSMATKMSLNEFAISFEDYGITNKILDLVAAQQGTTREKLTPGLAVMAPMFLAQFEMPELQAQVGKAVGAYLSDPNNIEVKAKPENSIPIMAFVALANNPPALLTLLNISIIANQ